MNKTIEYKVVMIIKYNIENKQVICFKKCICKKRTIKIEVCKGSFQITRGA